MHLDKNQKQQGLGLVKFAILIIFALVLIYVLYRVVNKKSAQLFSIPELYFHSHSKYFELLGSDTKVKAATIMLSDLGYHKDWSYFRAFKGSEVYQPDKIHFHYHDINTLSDQEKEDLFLIVRNQRGFVRGISEDFDSSKNELAYHFYFHRQVLEKRTASELESYLTGSVIHHFLVVSPITYSQELRRKHQLKISTLLEKKSLQLFEVVIKEMQASLVSRVFSTLIAPVYADECLGSLECLELSYDNCRCEEGGQVCLGNDDKDTCGPDDSCVCDEVCDNPDYDPTRCAGYEAQATCLDAHNTYTCGEGYCDEVQGSCYWECTAGCGNYGDWSDCSNSCGDGTSTRTRTCTRTNCTTYSDPQTDNCCSTVGSNNCLDSCTCNINCPSTYCGSPLAGGTRCSGQSCQENCTDNCPCRDCNPNPPSLSQPSNNTTYYNVPYVDLEWTHSGWGAACSNADNDFEICVNNTASGNYPNCSFVNQDQDDHTDLTYQFTRGNWLNSVTPDTYYWKVTADNGASQSTSSTYQFTVEQPEKECTVTLPDSSNWGSWTEANPTVQVTLTGNAQASYGNTVRLFATKLNGSQLLPNNISPAATEVHNPGGAYYYNLTSAACTSGTSSCTTTTTVSLPTPGNYYFHCDVSDQPNRCSGNPFCSYELNTVYGQPKPSPYGYDCSTWESCHDAPDSYAVSSDNVYFCAGAGGGSVSITHPTDNQTINMTTNPDGADGDVDISWNDPANKADLYDVRIYARGAYASPEAITDLNCVSDSDLTCLTNVSQQAYGFTPTEDDDNPNREYTVAIRGINNSCSPYLDSQVGDWVTHDFSCGIL